MHIDSLEHPLNTQLTPYSHYTVNLNCENSEMFVCPLSRCLLELDPVAQKHLAKLKRFRGQYDEWGNRIPRSQHQLLGRQPTPVPK